MEWDGLVPALQSNKIDAIIAGMSPTEERKKTIDFTENYYTSDFVMVIKKVVNMKMQNRFKISQVLKLHHN